MVSGLVTSPYDHPRICSGDARLIRIALKSFTSSNVSSDRAMSCELRAVSCGCPSWFPHSSQPVAQGCSQLLVALLESGDVDIQGRHLILARLIGDVDLFVLFVQNLNREGQALQLLHEHLEGFGHAGFQDALPLDDGLVCLDAADHVVRLDGQQLLQDVSGAVGLEGPDLHLAEALSTELRLAPQRLLSYQRVRAGGTRVNLILHQMGQFQHVNLTHRHVLVELLAGPPIEQPDLAALGQLSLLQLTDDRVLRGSVEDRRGRLVAELGGRPPQMSLEHLTDVHPGRNAEGVQDHADRSPIGQERHVLLRHDAGDDALVTVASRHLVAFRDLALLRDADADQLVDARWELVTRLTAEDLDVDDLPALALWHAQRGVLDLSCLLTEDGAQQALFRGELGLTLGRDLAHQDVSRLNFGPQVHDAALVEILQPLLSHVRDVAGDLFGTELRVARVYLVLLHVDRGERVRANQILADENGVLVVPAFPQHERNEHVLAEGQLAVIG